MKTKLIVNPASGQETAIDYLPAINARLREDGDVDIVLTAGEGDGVEAGRRAALEGYDRVFVAGGDGTLNEVLNGLAQVDGALGYDVLPGAARVLMPRAAGTTPESSGVVERQ
jgi:diacylglycerol kinase (ATP)